MFMILVLNQHTVILVYIDLVAVCRLSGLNLGMTHHRVDSIDSACVQGSRLPLLWVRTGRVNPCADSFSMDLEWCAGHAHNSQRWFLWRKHGRMRNFDCTESTEWLKGLPQWLNGWIGYWQNAWVNDQQHKDRTSDPSLLGSFFPEPSDSLRFS